MKIVIIEDDPQIVETVSLCFELYWPDAQVLSASEGNAGRELVRTESPDIVILDLGLPDIHGLEVCREIRLFSNVPIIMLTVMDSESDKVRGLEMGADDYITKPFSHLELLARVKALLRRAYQPEYKGEKRLFSSGNLSIDFAAREVRLGGEVVRLTPTEYNLLYHLVKDAGKVIPHSTLLERVWGPEHASETDYLKVYVQRLREKLEVNPKAPQMILTHWGVGYKFAAPEAK